MIWCMHVFVTWSTVKSRPHQKDMKKTFILLPNILQRPVTVLEKKRRQVWPASFDWWKSQDGCWEGLDGFGIYDRYPVAPSVLAYMLKPEIVVLQLRPDPSPANLECPTVARARSLPCLFPAKRGSWKMVSWNPPRWHVSHRISFYRSVEISIINIKNRNILRRYTFEKG